MTTSQLPASGEAWRAVPGFADYFVSDQGRVLSRRRKAPRLLRPYSDAKGYLCVELFGAGTTKRVRVHCLVAEAFHGPRPEAGRECRHLNDIKTDNRAVNLQWGTRSENQLDAMRNGGHPAATQTHCINGHEFTPENTYRSPGRPRRRECRMCKADRRLRAAS